MSETSGSSSNLFTLLIAGGISLVVGVSSGFLVNWLNEKSVNLTYDITAIQAFPGQQEKIGIVAVRVANDGQKELEEIQGNILFIDAAVKEISFQGLSPNVSTQQKSANGVEFRVPFLNPGEHFSVQVLVTPGQQTIQAPTVNLRAKGTVGRQETQAEQKQRRPIHDELLQLIAAVGAALGAASITIWTWLNGRKSTLGTLFGHSDDQRDIFAYALGCNGFVSEAELVRRWPRDWSYWAISDFLTERWLSSKEDKKLLSRGITAFEYLLGYAQIADSSARIVQINIARLASAAGNEEMARKHVMKATSKRDAVISKRLELDPVLSGFIKKAET